MLEAFQRGIPVPPLPVAKYTKRVEIVRVKNFGKEHGSILSRFLYAASFFVKSFFYTVKEVPTTDLIIVTTNPPFLGLIPVFVLKFSKIKYVTIIYDIYPDIAVKLGVFKDRSPIVRFWSFITRLIFNSSDKLVVIGEDMRSIIKEKVTDLSRIELIHNWSDSRCVFPVTRENNLFIREHKLESKKVLLYSGNMGRTHNVEPFLEAADRLQSREDILFIFIGSGQKRSVIEKTIQEKGLTNIKLLGYQPYELLNHVLSCPDLSLVCLEDDFTGYSVPSKTYGILAAGRPVLGILREDSEIAQTVKKFDCGVVFSSKVDGQVLADGIERLVKDRQQIERMGQNGFKAFKENFDLAISADKVLETY